MLLLPAAGNRPMPLNLAYTYKSLMIHMTIFPVSANCAYSGLSV